MKNSFSALVLAFFATVILLAPHLALAAMSGSQYSIYADSVSVGGVAEQTGSSYNLQGSIGEMVAGTSTGATYTLTAGYQAMDRSELSLSLSTASINLGSLSDSNISQAPVIATVTANAANGYSLVMDSVSGNIPSTVNDGAVTAGQNEYGFSVSGNDAFFSGDKAVTAGQVVASALGDRSSSATTMTFKASRNGNVQAASYTQTISVLLSANF